METPKQGNLFQEQDVDRLIAQVGRRPPEAIRERMHGTMEQEKERFLALERIRHRRQQREGRHGRGQQRPR